MAKYMIEETTTPQAAAGLLQNPEDRSRVLAPLFEAAGCKLEQFYVSGIENKAYLIVESPDPESVYTVAVNFQAAGAASAIKCILLMPVSEMVDLAKKAAGLGYHPPGR